MTTRKITRIAKRIAEDLFTNGGGAKASLLVLTGPAGITGMGGWCQDAVVNRVRRILTEELSEKRQSAREAKP